MSHSQYGLAGAIPIPTTYCFFLFFECIPRIFEYGNFITIWNT